MNDKVKLTQNEWQIVQAIRGMREHDQLLIIKKGKNNEQEFEVKTQTVSFFFKT